MVRLSESELEALQKKIRKSNLIQNEYLVKAVLNKKIVVVEGLDNVHLELKKIGNNINQLTKSVHQGKINCNDDLKEINKELGQLWQSLNQLVRKQA